ncbi:MAG: hypothetical protein U1F87_17895 [Kiritimatiellia bacterium]
MQSNPTLTSSLREACARVTRLRTGKILLLWGAFLLGTLFLLMGLDIWASPESRPLRWILSGTAWLAWSVVLVRGLALVVKRRPKPLEMARYLEEQHPEWQESVSTALELKKSGGVSPGLLDRIERQAVSSVREVRAPAEFPGAALKPAGRLLGAAALLMAVLFALWPQAAWTALRRVLMPWDDPGNAFTLQLEVTPGDQIMPEGASLGIQARLKGEDGAMAMLVCEFADGRTTRERMPSRPAATNAADGTTFALELPDLRRSFTYHVLAGRARSKPYQVQVEPLPDLKDLRAVITPPVYSGLAVSTNTWAVEPLAALTGSRVRLEATLNKPVKRASPPDAPRHAPEAERLAGAPGGAEWTFEGEPELRGEWTFHLTDGFGFTNAPISRLFRAIPDLAPRISILEPRLAELEMRPTDLLHIEYAIEEDFGLAGLLLKVNRGHDNREISQPQPGRDPASGLFRGDLSLNLPDIEAKPGQTLRVRIQATDNLPAGLKGPHVVSSQELVIKITDSSGSIARQQANKMNQKMEEKINQVQQAVNEARNKAEQQANEQAKHAETPDWVKKQLENLQKEMAEAEEKIDQAVKGPEAEFHPQTAEKLEDMAEKLDAAKEKADQIALQDTAQERADLAKEVQKAMEELAKEVQPLREQFNEERKSAEDWVRLQELADKQEQLALTAEKPKDEPQKNQWENQQRDVANQAAELVKNDPEAKTEVAETVAEQAESLAEQAEAAAKQEQKLSESSRQAAQKQNEQAEKSLGEALADQQRELAKEIAEQAKEAAQGRERGAAANPRTAAEQKNEGQTADAAKTTRRRRRPAGSRAGRARRGAQAVRSEAPRNRRTRDRPPTQAKATRRRRRPADSRAGRARNRRGTEERRTDRRRNSRRGAAEAARAAEQAAQKLDQGDIPAATEAANQSAEALAKAETGAGGPGGTGFPGNAVIGRGRADPRGRLSRGRRRSRGADRRPQGAAAGARGIHGGHEGGSGESRLRGPGLGRRNRRKGRLPEARTLAQTAQALGDPAQRAREAAQHAQNAQGQADAAERSAEQWEQQAAQNPANSQSAGQTADQQQAAANELRQTAQNAREVAQQAEAMAKEGQPEPADPANGDPAAQAAAGGQTPPPPAPPATPGRIDSDKLAEGFEAAAQAANAPTRQQAGQQAAQAATALRDAAKRDTPPALAGQPAPPGPAGSMTPGPVGSPQPGSPRGRPAPPRTCSRGSSGR